MSDISKFVDKIRKIAQENNYPELTALVEKWDFEDGDCETCGHSRWIHRSYGQPRGCITCGCKTYVYEE